MRYSFILSLPLLLAACMSNDKSVEQSKKELELLQKEKELLKRELAIDSQKRANSPEAPKRSSQSSDKNTDVASDPVDLIRIGSHDITLQWIHNDMTPPGHVLITKTTENNYRIQGGQKSNTNSDYLTIDGTLTPLNKKELIFEGKLIYLVEHHNSGKPCDKSGRHIFKSTQNRKYWRMQDMVTCGGGMVLDYVDIYF